MRRKSVTLLLIGSLVLSMAACTAGGENPGTAASAQIELVDPVNAEISYEEAARRNLYDTKIFAATVVPYIEEYSADYAFQFGSYGAYYGEKVKAGQELILADTENIDKQIKEKKEYILTMEEEYEDYVKKQTEALEEQRALEERFYREMKKNESSRPAEFLTNDDGESVANPAYAEWKVGYDFNEGCYRIAKNDGDIIERDLEQRKTLFEMDVKHQRYLLKSLQKTRSKTTVSTRTSGEVVALRGFDRDNLYVPAEVPVAAVGDMSQKLLRCEYVNNNTIKKAKEVYALIDGVKYEVEYHSISTDEYVRLSANGGKVYSTFSLLNAGDEVQIGDYAMITIVTKELEDVVSVPKDAIKKDDAGRYVYVYRDGKTDYVPIQTGYSDGVYTEVTEGLAAGDKVLYTPDQKVTAEKTVKLEKGDYGTDFSERAQLLYASDYSQRNTVEYGTTYFVEYQVELFQHVNKGDVIATVRVEPDKLGLARNELRLSRLQERFADYKEKNKDHTEEEYYVTAVENYEEQIKDVKEIIAEQKADFATTKILAEKTGVIIGRAEYKAESIVQKDAYIAAIADENYCYVEVEDPNQILQYGNQVEVAYVDGEEKEHSTYGTVVSMSRMGVSSDLQTDKTEVLLPKDEIATILQGVFSGAWWDRYRYTVKAKVRSMDNVVLVPKAAVYDYGGGMTYVYVKDENGNAKAQSFVSGGHNDSYYWVVQGLTEGMEVCLK